MANRLDSIFEEREELMISPTGDCDPNLRTAHFLQPSSTSRNGPVSELPPLPLSSRFGFSDHKIAVEVKFKGRRNPPKKWREWVDSLRSRYEPKWKKLGIFYAIMSSTYHIQKDNDLLVGVAQKWCPETNTFIFPWGEATMTLEDMLVLGGFPVLGDPYFSTIESGEMRIVLDNLNEACSFVQTTTYPWMKHFMGTGHELEHEAFLSLWLSRFVYPSNGYDLIAKKLFPVAVRLARGIPVALAPLVLASIYRDLSVLKQEMVKFVGKKGKYSCLLLDVWAPFQLLQLWVWERFPTLRPKPNVIRFGEPRAARWHRVMKIKVGNLRMALDSAGECFQWRPYASGVSNWQLPKFYREQEEWVLVGSDLDKELESFARCLRVSQLVEPGSTQPYLPHRVAMQFGLDQDILGCVPRSNNRVDVAWNSYNRPIGDKRLYIPPRLFESDVTKSYLDWWKQSVLKVQMLPEDEAMTFAKKSRIQRGRCSKQDEKMTGSVGEGEAPLLQVLRSVDNDGSGGCNRVSDGNHSSCSQSKSHSSSATSQGVVRYKSLEDIVEREASMQVMKSTDESSSPNVGVNTASIKNRIEEHSSDRAIKKPKLEPEDNIGEIDKVIAQLKVEFAKRPLDKQFKTQINPAEVEKMIVELKEEFGIRGTTRIEKGSLVQL